MKAPTERVSLMASSGGSPTPKDDGPSPTTGMLASQMLSVRLTLSTRANGYAIV